MTRPLTAADVLIVFDTNALLPLLVGKTRRALFLRQAWQDKRFILALTPTDIDEALTTLRQRACNLPGLYEGVAAVTEDFSDNIFLACALEAGADYLVTRDAHLLNLKYYHGTQIVSLDQLARLLGAEH